MALPTYTVPGAPPPPTGGQLPYIGPYAQNQALAQRAFEMAQSQLSQQRGSALQAFGFTPDGNGGYGVDAANPYGSYQSMLGANQQESDAADTAARSRGLTGGLAGQLADHANFDAGGRTWQFGQQFLNSMQGLDATGEQNQWNLDNSLNQNQAAWTEAAIQQGLFTPAANQLSKDELSAKLLTAARAWANRYQKQGGLNKANQTFAQRLAMFNANQLYGQDPKAMIAGVNV